MYYALFYKTIDNYVERRQAYRDKHLLLAQEAHKKGDLVMAGALDEPTDGAILIFKGEDPYSSGTVCPK